MSPQREDPELNDLASALRELHPRPDALDHGVLMYRAGQASAHSWAWSLVTTLAAALALVLGIAGWVRPEPTLVERTVYRAAPVPSAPDRKEADAPASDTPSSPEGAGAWSSYVHLKEKVLEDGLEGLPASPNNPEPAPSLEELLRSF
jgi:hypothetical protein